MTASAGTFAGGASAAAPLTIQLARIAPAEDQAHRLRGEFVLVSRPGVSAFVSVQAGETPTAFADVVSRIRPRHSPEVRPGSPLPPPGGRVPSRLQARAA